RWDTGGSVGGFSPLSTPPAGETLAQLNSNNLTTPDPTLQPGVYHPRIPRYSKLAYDQDRIGLTGSVQWAPNSANSLNLDVLYSDFKVKRDENYLEAFSFSRNASQFGKPATILQQGIVDGNKTLVYGLFDGVDMRTENRHDEFVTKFEEATLTGSHELTDRLTIDESLGYQKSDFNNPIQTTITLDRQNSNGYSWDFRGSNRLPALSYGFDVTDPNNWQFSNAGNAAGGQSEIRLRPNTVVDTFKTANLNSTFKATDRLSVRGGLEYKKFGFDTTEQRRASETSVPVLPAGVTLASVTKLTTCCSGLNLPAGTPTTWLIADINSFNQLFNIYSNSGTFAVTGISNTAARGNNRGVQEEDEGAYGQVNFNFEAGIPFRGDVGVRYVKTKQSSYGYVVTTAVQRAEAEHDYSDVLPALNVVAEFQPDLLLRLGLAKVMARPSLAQVTPGGTINTVGNLSVSTGNPLLDPIRAKTADLSLEWYFAQGSLLSGAVFYKDIDSFVQTLTTNQVFNTT
ncbi:MAG TPA: TonB-dependent receptor, partial [Steroidobacteraceae bacterium]|nr:TonB-dependent receptor [Steroidobacteraceae bacterium]